MDVNVIVEMEFFIGDLHSEQFGFAILMRVYREQGMSKADFEQFTKTKVEFISFNNFLFTNKNCRACASQNMVGIPFVHKNLSF
jgi:hypothetical protein